MMDAPTRLDLLNIARTYIRTRAGKIDPKQVDTIGSDVNLFVGSVSVVAYELVNQLVAALAPLFIDNAEKEELDRLLWDRYKLVRKGAAPAVVSVTFSRVVMTAGAGAVPINTSIQTLTGVEFITTSQATFGATTATATCWVRSVQAGSANQAAADTIKRIPGIASLWDTTLTVTNPLASAYAADAESDDDFRNRGRNFWLTAVRGTLSAIVQGALAVPGVASATAVEELMGANIPARCVRLTVADRDGLGGGGLVIPLDDYRAAGIPVVLDWSSVQYVDITLALVFRAGSQTDLLTAAVRTAVLGTVNRCGANDTLLRASLLETLKSFQADGLIPTNDSVVDPVGDLVPVVGKTIRTTFDRVRVV